MTNYIDISTDIDNATGPAVTLNHGDSLLVESGVTVSTGVDGPTIYYDIGNAANINGQIAVNIDGTVTNDLNAGVTSLVDLEQVKNSEVTIGSSGSLLTTSDYEGGGIYLTGTSDSANIAGTISTTGAGIAWYCDSGTIQIQPKGEIDAGDGLDIFGDDNQIDNAGKIYGQNNADNIDAVFIYGSATGNTILNTGLMDSSAEPTQFAIEIDTQAGTSNSIVNEGTLTGGAIAIKGGPGNESVVNSGKIIGTVDLDGGNDSFIELPPASSLHHFGHVPVYVFSGPGDDTLIGRGEQDFFDGGKGADRIDGGGGNDWAVYSDSGAGVTIDLARGIARGGDAAGDRLTDIRSLEGSRFADRLTGDGHNNSLQGNGGADLLAGGGGHDTFVYAAVSDSTGPNYDTITGFDAKMDKFDLPSNPAGGAPVQGIDTEIRTGLLSTAHFNEQLARAVNPGTLAAHHAVLFAPSSGDLKGALILVIDANGTAGYQAGKDYVIDLDHPAHLEALSPGNFI